jgi:hypothetical protein
MLYYVKKNKQFTIFSAINEVLINKPKLIKIFSFIQK